MLLVCRGAQSVEGKGYCNVQLTHTGRTLHAIANGHGKEILHVAQLAIRVGEARIGTAAACPTDLCREDLIAFAAGQVSLPAGAG